MTLRPLPSVMAVQPVRERMRLSVIVPAFREARHIRGSMERLSDCLDGLDLAYEVILVCDGNPDGTYSEALAGASHRVHPYGYSPNMGKGYALRYGFERSSGDLVAFIDADLDLDPDGIAHFVDVLTEEHADVVVGSKRHPDSQVTYPAFRRFQSWVYQGIVGLLFDLRLTDTQTGLKLFRREVLEAAMPRLRVRRFAFDLELLVLAHRLGYEHIVEAPVHLNYHFGSTTGVRAVFDVLNDTLAIFWRLRVEHAYDRTDNVPMAQVNELPSVPEASLDRS